MKQLLALLVLILGFQLESNGQVTESLSFLHSRPTVGPAAQKMSTDTIELPIVDDFSVAGIRPNPNFWADQKVYINTQMADSLLSVGVATFDGLDEYGWPYLTGNDLSDTLNDVLTSRYLNLAGKTNVFLSFLYQPQGIGEAPESDDSLVVDFWSVDDTLWVRQFRVQGSSSHRFKNVILPVADSLLRDGFSFRIGTYGARSGDFDHWHIDYVQFDENRNINDTIIEDPAYNVPPPSLLKEGFSLPWFHVSASDFKDSLTFGYRRNGPVPPGGWPLNLGKYELYNGSSLISQRLAVPVITNTLHNQDLTFDVPVGPLPIAPTDTFRLSMTTWFDGTAAGIRTNDTLTFGHSFSNYYAFDDGSAERAYGISNVLAAQTAMEFKIKTADQLRGLYLYFSHAGTDATDNEFQILVWESIQGQPGNILYKSDSLYTPQYSWQRNKFIPYSLDTSVTISGTVFIGVRQKTAEPLNIGYDIRNRGPNVFYGDLQTWYQSVFEGALMLRPYFQDEAYDLSTDEISETNLWSVYPNPASDKIHIGHPQGSSPQKVALYDISGRQLSEVKQESSLDVSSLPSGLYLVHIFANEWEQPQIAKVIIQ